MVTDAGSGVTEATAKEEKSFVAARKSDVIDETVDVDVSVDDNDENADALLPSPKDSTITETVISTDVVTVAMSAKSLCMVDSSFPPLL